MKNKTPSAMYAPPEAPYTAYTNEGIKMILMITDETLQNMAWTYLGRVAVGRWQYHEMPQELRKHEDLAIELEKMAQFGITRQIDFKNTCITNHNVRMHDNIPLLPLPFDDRRTTVERPSNEQPATDRLNHNHKNNKEENNKYESESNSVRTCIDSHSDSQPKEPSRPRSRQEAYDYAESQQWPYMEEDVDKWFEVNENNGWLFYKDSKNGKKYEPMDNWQGSLKRWLKNGAQKEIDAIIAERCNKHGQGAIEFGHDKLLDHEEYVLLHKLKALSPKNEQARIQRHIEEYEKCYSKPEEETQF